MEDQLLLTASICVCYADVVHACPSGLSKIQDWRMNLQLAITMALWNKSINRSVTYKGPVNRLRGRAERLKPPRYFGIML